MVEQKSNDRPKIIAGIPAYNEEQFIGEVVSKARRYVDEVIVVDDGSTDNTSEAAQATGAEVIKHKTCQGAGAATKTAFEAAKRSHADILVTLDGDGQHNPDEIPQLLTPILNREADLVIGSRFLQSNLRQIPKYRKFGIDVITFFYNFGSKVRISDSQCCFRAHNRRLIEAVNITEAGFGFSVQVLIQARKKGFIIKEVPISCIYHSQGSSLNPITHGLVVAFDVIKHRLFSR
ncbi:MAG: glycosyltransferase family 2 protein [Dehalococcoidia bacterium]|nr:glycosyltransferase family 2 protein [Dehalococcoidia bacterium]